MLKELFLEYKFRDFSDEELIAPAPTGVIASFEKLESKRAEQIRKLSFSFGISVTSLPGKDTCPASEDAKRFFLDKIRGALRFNPDVIWFDHLRFEGRWEKGGSNFSGLHPDCEYCRGKDRTEVILGLTKIGVREIQDKTKIGYFAVPFKDREFGEWNSLLGQNHKRLGNLFDYMSPMLYHRMIGKPAGYISEYVQYLDGLDIKAKILPIIQLKDMPDELLDTLSINEISEAVSEAARPPSAGVAVFSWDQTIEKGKLEGVSKILRSAK